MPKSKNDISNPAKAAKPDFILKVSEATGWSYETAKENMDIARVQLGVPYKLYFNSGYYAMTRGAQEKRARIYLRSQSQRQKRFEIIKERTGKSKKEVLSDIRSLNDLGICRINLKKYYIYGIFCMEQDERLRLLEILRRIEESTASLRRSLTLIDLKELSYDSIRDELREYYELVSSSITEELKARIADNIGIVKTKCGSGEAPLSLFTDVEVCRLLLRFRWSEYEMYHIADFGFSEKRSFLCDLEREEIIETVNGAEISEVTANKYALYEKIGVFFKRELAAVHSEADLSVFTDFLMRHGEFVIKPLNDSLGRGVELIRVEDGEDPSLKFRELLSSYRTFLMEERVIQDDRMAAFNPDSINTVRHIVYYDGTDTVNVTCFMRTGRKGSFVDNGGAGGIFASVNCDTGILETNGTDENGREFITHPDSGLPYKGFRIPNWEDALKTGCDAIKALGHTGLLGWDLALNKDGEWVVIEGNALPQFLNQSSLRRGLKPELVKALNYRPTVR